MKHNSNTLYRYIISLLKIRVSIFKELEAKVRDLETTNDVQEAKLKGMEEKRKSFLEKSEVMQVCALFLRCKTLLSCYLTFFENKEGSTLFYKNNLHEKYQAEICPKIRTVLETRQAADMK